MAACIQLLSTPILIYGLSELSSDEIKDGYFYFLIMLVRDVANLLSPVIHKDDIKNIKNNLIEIVSLKEKIFPDSTARIIYHQLIHLVDQVTLTGPISSNNSMWGERMLGKQKLNKTIGGTDDIGTLARRSEADECNAERILKVDDNTGAREAFLKKVERFYKAKNNIYFKFPFTLLKPDKQILKWNSFEKTELLKALISEIEKQSKSEKEALAASPLYRLYVTHKILNVPDNLLTFIDSLYLAIDLSILRIPYEVKIIMQYPQNFIEKKMYKTHIILTDLSSVKTFLDSSIKVRRQAIVYGERFNCRGQSCSEKSIAIGDPKRPTNDLNNLSTNCTHKKSYGSWVMFHSIPDEFENMFDASESELNIGQLNYFFRVTMDRDSILHNVPFASVTARNYEHEYNILYVINLNDDQNFDSGKYFTAATNIVPTIFGVGFLDEKNKACIIAKARHKNQSAEVKLQYSPSNKPVKLKLVKLNMNRDQIVYHLENNETYNCIDYDI